MKPSFDSTPVVWKQLKWSWPRNSEEMDGTLPRIASFKNT